MPITPYAGGLFDGAVTPRQIAEKAKANPKEAAPYFENGDVAKWYASNGWAYPVQGPIMPGMGSIQQFFEALGVAKPPKVDFNPKTLDLHGAVGKTIEAKIEVTTAERRSSTAGPPATSRGSRSARRSSPARPRHPVTIRIPEPCPPTLEATINVDRQRQPEVTVAAEGRGRRRQGGRQAGAAEEFVPLEVIEEEETPMMLEIDEETPTGRHAARPTSRRCDAGAPPPSRHARAGRTSRGIAVRGSTDSPADARRRPRARRRSRPIRSRPAACACRAAAWGCT